ncbi:unnamed protein product [Symbiodinium necroappetens]|uniref:Uncharacterized protein n=1 Tax=Symbiodinium necroappetens TaxID=1628268 RepID=A0A812L8S7_9DINO|nr:unnamed protein product [Symbiodinium necroappetens]
MKPFSYTPQPCSEPRTLHIHPKNMARLLARILLACVALSCTSLTWVPSRGGSPSPRLPRVSVARQAAHEKTLSPEELEEQEEQEQAAGSPFRFRNEYLVALLVLIVAGTVFNPFQ